MMKTKKALVFLGVLILGSAVTTVIDHFIGVSFKDVGVVAQLTHIVAYMLWGAAVLLSVKWLG